ncbi:MAG TPA: sigma-70 family RNA polymerase sigma factor [Tepidisphaeraceae bacterium]|jgi:RNA polymerase sigma-70 factor (ECF subfamily)
MGKHADGDDWIRLAVDRFEKPLTLYALRLLGNVEAARDVVQETFLRLCAQNRSQIEPKLAEWLYTVTRNRALDIKRKDRRMSLMTDQQQESTSSAQPPPPQLAEEKDSAGQIAKMLQLLPPNQQEVIRLKFQHGLSYKEISSVTKLTVTNVGFLIHTGLKTIRQRLTQNEDASSMLRQS